MHAFRSATLLLLGPTLVVGALGTDAPAIAQQVENAVLCRENLPPPPPPIAEPVAMSYGDSTSECLIDPATDIDTFVFAGTAGDTIRINVLGQTPNYGPTITLRDPMGQLVPLNGNAAGASCQPGYNGTCAFAANAMLSNSGTHIITIADIGNNNIGSYTLQLERLFPIDHDYQLTHDSSVAIDGRVVEFLDVTPSDDWVTPPTDLDHYFFYGTAGTTVWIPVRGLTANFGPYVQVIDPAGDYVPLNGHPDSAWCQPGYNGTCSFTAELFPAETGIYSVVIGDFGGNNSGNYVFNLYCVVGECANDADAAPDTRRVALRYGDSIQGSLDVHVDGDAYVFLGSPGDTISLSGLGLTPNLGPWIQLRDPAGQVVLDGIADGAGCQPGYNGTCSFNVQYSPALAGPYTIDLFDNGTNNSGDYQLSLNCVFSPGDFVCENLPGRFENDVPEDYWAFRFIEIMADAGVTSGCGALAYCPEAAVTRSQMAVFLERGMQGGNYQPPACDGSVFTDVNCAGFADAFIEQLYADGVTSGCPYPSYCPSDPVTRAQMAVFLLRGRYGADYTPPAATGSVFLDVPISHWAAPFIEQLAAEGITSGCGGGNYCPDDLITRASMAVFVTRAFGLPDVLLRHPSP